MTSTRDTPSSPDVIGVLFGADRLFGCRAVPTLFGSVRYQQANVDVVDGDLTAALAELLRELSAERLSLPIAAAIPTEECYFATRPIASSGTKASPRTLLRESLRSSSVRLDQMAIDVMYWQPDRRTVAGICAAPIQLVESIRTAVSETKHSLQRLEPIASSLVAVAPEREGRERRSSLTTRVFLGRTRLLAVMSRGVRPIHWQSLPLPPGDEAMGIVSAIRSLETAANACGLDRTPDSVVIHGRPELQTLTDRKWLADSLQANLRWVESPMLDGESVARTLADRLLVSDEDGFDLVREHRDPLQLRRVIPYREIVGYVLVACVLACLLCLRVGAVQTEHTALVSSVPPIVADGCNPKSERDQLNGKANAVSSFLDKRIRWSGVLADVARSLPEEIRLTNILASAPMKKSGGRGTKSAPATLVLQAECGLGDAGSMPQSLDGLAESLHALESVGPHFDSVQLGNVHRMRTRDKDEERAAFSVIFTAKTIGGR
jgi:hypothetical protein